MEARAALYAASIAKYGVTTPQVTLPGGEVGIPASMATVITPKHLLLHRRSSPVQQGYSLYKQLPDLSDNFANLFLDKNSSEASSLKILRQMAAKPMVLQPTISLSQYLTKVWMPAV
jgi:hypothetical protein